MALPITPLNLQPADEKALLEMIRDDMKQAIEDHKVREALYVKFRREYKAKPDQEVKNFPWQNASNIVVPLIDMTVDAIVSRLVKAMLGAKDFCEVEIKARGWDNVTMTPPNGTPINISMEKEVRDWISQFVKSSGARDEIRSLFHDVALLGDGFAQPIWTEETRTYHQYGPSGQIVELPVPDYTGVKWHIPAPEDIVVPRGFDEWAKLPWIANRLRYTWSELQELVAQTGSGYMNIAQLGTAFLTQGRVVKESDAKRRDDARYLDTVDTAKLGSVGPAQIFTFYQLQGKFPINSYDVDGKKVGTRWEEIILIYSADFNLFIRAIFNPFFGKARHFVRIPYLMLPHEMFSMGVAEQIEQFQAEASTSHNQVIDAGTAANAGILAVTDECDLGPNEQVYPGKQIRVPNPDKDVRVYHLGADSGVLGSMEDRSIRYAESRSGVSAYHLGMESSVVGSRATATGTTALIGEGNLRFWMSIDDIRAAIEELLYLTIQLEQQMRPEGYEWAPGRWIQFPQGDVRTSLGLKLFLTSEKINRDLEVQSLMMLLQVLNDYYMRLMQAAAIIINPAFPQPQKLMVIQVMDATQRVIKRFVERFDLEDIEQIVPGLMDALNSAMTATNALGIQNVPTGVASPVPPPGPGSAPGGVGPGAPPSPLGGGV